MKKLNSKKIIYTAISAGLLCVISPFALPLGVVPVTLCTLLIYIFAYINEPKISILSVIVYIILGALGLPVFSSFSAGIGHIISPVGGFIVGYIPMVMILAFGFKRSQSGFKRILIMISATLVLYLIGVLWYIFSIKTDEYTAISISILPFLPGDILKIITAYYISPKIKSVINL